MKELKMRYPPFKIVTDQLIQIRPENVDLSLFGSNGGKSFVDFSSGNYFIVRLKGAIEAKLLIYAAG